jgi:YHS domain-containing protein
MRCVFKPTIAALAVMGLTIAASLPVLAQSGSRTAPSSGSGDRTSPPVGSGQRANQQAPLALEGYCPVSILEMRKWVKGDPALRIVYDGRTYLFANETGKKMFEANPAKYIPALGGDCVVALVKMGKRVPGDIRHAAFHDGRLFLFSNADTKKMFLGAPASYANSDLALGGNCAVCAAGGENTPGKLKIAAFHKGLRYFFPSTEQRDEFLAHPEKHVDPDGMVNYAAWKASETDRAALKQYLAALSQADPEAKTTKEGNLAFWINAYNALTVHGILEVYPTSSIRNHTAKVLGYNIWKDLLLPVGDKKYSLDAIEHQVLRKLGEPRIHFAIVCASIGCPRLRNEAYTPAKFEAQLADNTRDFFGRQRNLQVDSANRRVQVSSILDWFGKDFAPTPQKALATLADYMPDEATKRLVAGEDFSVSHLDYDWSLNTQ